MIPIVLLAVTMGTTPNGQAPITAAGFSGTWRLDTYLSDNPEQVARSLQFDTGEVNEDIVGPAGIRRQGTERAPAKADISSDDRKKLTELTRAVRFAPVTLTISQSEALVTIAAGQDAARALRPDGKAERHQLEAGTINRTTTWMGPQLVVAYEVGRAGTLTYTHSLVPTTGQLLIRVNFERVPGQPGPFEIKLVYDRVP